MVGKYYTLLIFPGAHGQLHKMYFRPFAVQMALGFTIAVAATVGALANSYTRMLWKAAEYNTVRTEREALKTHCRSLEGVITRSNEELMSLQSLAAEVAMAYGFTGSLGPGFPTYVQMVANRGHASQGAEYGASVYAFNMMKLRPAPAFYRLEVSSPLRETLYEDSATPSIWPVRGMITAGFGQRMDPFTGEGAFHTGVDIAAPVGTPVKAAADGILFFAGQETGYGNEALIDHGYGLTTKYAHLNTLLVVVGQEVKQGEILGTVGTTGRTTGPHLHYEVLVHGTPVNPARYLGVADHDLLAMDGGHGHESQ